MTHEKARTDSIVKRQGNQESQTQLRPRGLNYQTGTLRTWVGDVRDFMEKVDNMCE